MSDDDLITEMARVWVDGGGDSEGIAWCISKLQIAVMMEVERRNSETMADNKHAILVTQMQQVLNERVHN